MLHDTFMLIIGDPNLLFNTEHEGKKDRILSLLVYFALLRVFFSKQ
jgi:hypothetical protein